MPNQSKPGILRGLVEAEPARPRTLAEARRAVERSRQQISSTLDELEDRIVDTKESIQRKADVIRPAQAAIRKAPLIALGVAVAVGLLLGSLGGSDDDDDEDEFGFSRNERKALEEWRRQRRKLLMEEAEEAGESFSPETPGAFSRMLRAVGHEVGGVALGIIGTEIAERFVGRSPRDADSDEDDFEGDDTEGEDGYDDDFDGYDDEDLLDDDVISENPRLS
jgi:ElaB/YqjD/DUF883 family membrane-anchored ribosome-binding protein